MGAWAMVERKTSEIVGTILLKPLPGDTRIEVGWHLAHKHWGRGLATEAGCGALVYGFDQLQLARIFAIVAPGNRASIRVCERLGMEDLGLTDQYHDMTLSLFAISPDDMPSQ